MGEISLGIRTQLLRSVVFLVVVCGFVLNYVSDTWICVITVKYAVTKLNASVHHPFAKVDSEVCETISFQVGKMTIIIKLYILIRT